MSRAGDSTSPLHVVVGAGGQVGRALVAELGTRNLRVRAVGRSLDAKRFPGAEVALGDIVDEHAAARLCEGATVVYGCFGAPYGEWQEAFPRMARGLLAGARASRAKLVFSDNLYAYGPQTTPLVETMKATSYGRKPRLRAEIATMLLDAHAAGDARVVVARASDFYGPGVTTAMLGEPLLRSVLAGKRALVIGDIDAAHTFTFVPDLARTLVTLGEADDTAGAIWHVPSARAVSVRAVIERFAALGGRSARFLRLPRWASRAASWVSPMVREIDEMSFQWDRPFLVSHAKYAARFGDWHTPLEEGLSSTLAWLRGAARARAFDAHGTDVR